MLYFSLYIYTKPSVLDQKVGECLFPPLSIPLFVRTARQRGRLCTSLPRWRAFFSHVSSKVCGKSSFIMPASSFLGHERIRLAQKSHCYTVLSVVWPFKCTTISSCKTVQECVLEVCAYPFYFFSRPVFVFYAAASLPSNRMPFPT